MLFRRSVASSSFAILWTVGHQTPLSMGFSTPGILEWIAISFSGDPPDQGIEPTSLVSPTWADEFFTTEPPGSLSGVTCPLPNW